MISIKIKQLPEVERPYEKLELYGEKSLSNAELLAIVIKTGTKDKTAVDIANNILSLNKNNSGDLEFLKEMTLEELKKIKGIGRVKAIQLKAICEISVRMNKKRNYKKIQITGPEDVASLFMNELRFEKKEIVKLVMLNSKNIVEKILDIAIGGTNFANIEIRSILSETVKANMPRIILVHNHPTGDSTPSNKDIEITEKIKQSAKLLNIELLDHIVIGNMNYNSIIEYKKR